MTLAELTDLYSIVLRRRPDLRGVRDVDLFIQDCIDELKSRPERPREPRPLVPVDLIDV